MNLDHLKMFIDLAKTHSYTKTAANVYLTQPAVTQAMRSLENGLGVKLLERNRSGVMLTKCGEIFFNQVTDIVEQLEQAVENVKRASERYESSISVGYSGTMLETRKVGELQKFLSQHSDMTIHMENFSMRYLNKYLLDGQCDMVFHIQENQNTDDSFDFYPLEQGKFAVAMSRKNPLHTRKLLTFEDLADEAFIMINTRQCFAEQQAIQEKVKSLCSKRTIYYSDSFTLMHALVKAALGIAILPDFLESGDNELCIVPLDYDVQLTYGITVLRGNNNPVVRQVLKEVIGSLSSVKDEV